MTKFRIDSSFRIEGRGFAFVGEVVEGVVQPGMQFLVPEAGHRWRLKVKAVECVLMPGGKEKIGLIVEDGAYLPGLGVGWTADLIWRNDPVQL